MPSIMKPSQSLKILYALAFADGLALLALVFFAVPMKHLFDSPVFVSVLGPTHGFLFVSLVATLIYALKQRAVPSMLALKVFALALVPLGGFYADYLIKKHGQQVRSFQ
jgi:integral membrane protein